MPSIGLYNKKEKTSPCRYLASIIWCRVKKEVQKAEVTMSEKIIKESEIFIC